MKNLNLFILIVITVFSFAFTQETQESPTDYVAEALNRLEKRWVHKDSMDWVDIRDRYMNEAEQTQSIDDAYPIVRQLILELDKDGWSYLMVRGDHSAVAPKDLSGFRVLAPDWVVAYVFEDSPAERAGLRVGDSIVAVNGEPIELSDAERAGVPRTATGAGGVYFSCKFTPATYCDYLTTIYADGAELSVKRVGSSELLTLSISGEIENNNLMTPTGMTINNLGYLELVPLKLSNDAYVAMVAEQIADIEQTATCGWMIDLRRHAGGGGPFLSSIAPILELERERRNTAEPLPLAVLLSPMTGSMGEKTAGGILLHNARSFGEETWGDHPIVQTYQLSETTLMGVRTTDYSIKPDVDMKIDWTRFQSDEDPVILAAQEWLELQPSCLAE